MAIFTLLKLVRGLIGPDRIDRAQLLSGRHRRRQAAQLACHDAEGLGRALNGALWLIQRCWIPG